MIGGCLQHIDTIQNDTPGNGYEALLALCRATEEARLIISTNIELNFIPFRPFVQEPEVEVDDVPANDDVWVKFREPCDHRFKQRFFIRDPLDIGFSLLWITNHNHSAIHWTV